jgi:putative tryptophan/tyrosine transport system substrate-binding protein
MTVTIGRRELLAALGGAAIAWPLAARAQQPGKLPTIGYLGTTTASAWGPWTAAFVQRLRELGWIEGRNLAIEYRWADGRTGRLAEIAAEFVRLKVDIIVAGGSAAVAAKQATSVIPIVVVLGDPIATGLVASLARPGGNVTGLSNQQTDLHGKRLELLREVLPSLRRLAIMANVDYPEAVLEMREVQAISKTLGLEVGTVEIRRAEDIEPAFEAHKGRADALYKTKNRSQKASGTRIPRTNYDSCGNGATKPATPSRTNTSIVKAAEMAPRTASSSLSCSRTPINASSTVCWSGRSTVSPAKAW